MDWKNHGDQKIRLNSSFLRLALSFLTVLSLGLYTRVFLSQIPLEEKILESVPLPKGYELTLTQPGFQFRSGGLPLVGVSIPQVDMVHRDCPSQKMKAQGLLLSLDLWSLLWGQAQLKSLDMDWLELRPLKNCDPKVLGRKGEQKEAQVEKALRPQKTSQESLQKLLSDKNSWIFSDHWLEGAFDQLTERLKKPGIQRLRVAAFQFSSGEPSSPSMSFQGNFRLHLKKRLRGVLQIQKVFLGGKDFSFINSRIHFTGEPDQWLLNMRTKAREGRQDLELKIQRAPGWPTHLQVGVEKFPLSPVMAALLEEKQLQYLWASCAVSTQAPWAQLLDQKLSFQACHVDGPYGDIQLAGIKAFPTHLEALEVVVNEMNLDQVLQDRGELSLSGVFSSYGILSAHLQWQKGRWALKGQLDKAEIIFSNDSLRDIQKVRRIPFSGVGEKDRWKSQISHVEFEEGLFSGDIKIKGDSQGRVHGEVSIDRFQFNPRIYELMINARPAEASLHGRFSMDGKGGLSDWSALITVGQLHSDLYEFNGLKVRGGGGPKGEALIGITVGHGALNRQGVLFPWLEPTHLEAPWNFEKLEFNELSTHLELIGDRSVKWKRGYIFLKNGWQLSTEGYRGADKKVKAWLQWDRPDRRYMRWGFKGSLFKGQWWPQTPWVRKWLKEHPGFLKENKNIILTPASDLDFSKKTEA